MTRVKDPEIPSAAREIVSSAMCRPPAGARDGTEPFPGTEAPGLIQRSDQIRGKSAFVAEALAHARRRHLAPRLARSPVSREIADDRHILLGVTGDPRLTIEGMKHR